MTRHLYLGQHLLYPHKPCTISLFHRWGPMRIEVTGMLCLSGLLLWILHVVQATTMGTKFANVTVWGTLILSDPKIAPLLSKGNKQVENMKIESAHLRRKQAEETIKLLPFPVVIWSSMYAQDCPEAKPRMIPRGCDISHYQIWNNWEYEGRLGSHKSMASDSDVLIVFEDDAVITVKNITRSLEQELSPENMISDLILFGWCFEKLCLHAYAVTRAGVTKILSAWDICSSLSVDNALKNIASKGIITWQKARPESYSDRLEEFRNGSSVQKGMFVQKKGLVSLNRKRRWSA